jgi:hypothetical protein
MTSSAVPKDTQTRPAVFVHVGEAKTGTTYLQNLFDDNRQALREDGLLYPTCGGSGHVQATLDLRQTTFKSTPDPSILGAWDRLVDEIRGWGGPALISSELLAPASPEHIERLRETLGFADVHVVFTVRDLARQLPAAWQERVKNRGQETFAQWLQAVHDPESAPTSAGLLFWRLHDVPTILGRWSANLPPEHVHVITVPPSGGDRSLLWQRFAQVLGVDPERYRQPHDSVNSSLGAAEVSVVRRVNVALGGDEFPWPHYDKFLKWYLTPELSKRTGLPIDLPAAEFDWAAGKSQQVAKAIADAGYDVVGDLDDLSPAKRPTGLDPDDVPGDLQADVGVAGITAMVNLLVSGPDVRDVPELRSRVAVAEAKLREHRQLPPRERIKRCFVELADQVGWLRATHRAYRKVRRRKAAQ